MPDRNIVTHHNTSNALKALVLLMEIILTFLLDRGPHGSKIETWS